MLYTPETYLPHFPLSLLFLSLGYQLYDPALFSSFSTMMSSLFPTPEQQAAMNEDQRVFLSHFHTAFGKLVAAQQGSGGPGHGTPAGATPGGNTPMSIPNPASLLAAFANHAGGTFTTETPGDHGAGGAGTSAQDTTPGADGSSVDLADPKTQQALAVGQMMMNMAPLFPGMAAALSAMTKVAQGATAGVASPVPAPVAAAPVMPAAAPASAPLQIAPLSAPQFVQTTFGDILAARVAGVLPKGSPFTASAWTPPKSAGAANTPGDESKGMALKTPVSMQAARPAANGRKPEGLAFLAMAASMEDE